jgi:hypothetical protein
MGNGMDVHLALTLQFMQRGDVHESGNHALDPPHLAPGVMKYRNGKKGGEYASVAGPDSAPENACFLDFEKEIVKCGRIL